MSISSKKSLGNKGEDLTSSYLIDKGFSILARNFTTRTGEIDVIAAKNNLVLFVEVKTRSHTYFNMSEIITPTKQRKIILTAKQFILKHQLSEKAYRFDVALITHTNQKITYLENAFYAE
jgi:putative endonuclease